jgi:hypothetical protein
MGLHAVRQPGHGTFPKTTGEIQSLLNQLESCDKQITPICLRALYGWVYEPLAASKNSYGIGLLIQYKLNEASDEELFAEGKAKGFQITASLVSGSFQVHDIERDARDDDDLTNSSQMAGWHHN